MTDLGLDGAAIGCVWLRPPRNSEVAGCWAAREETRFRALLRITGVENSWFPRRDQNNVVSLWGENIVFVSA